MNRPPSLLLVSVLLGLVASAIAAPATPPVAEIKVLRQTHQAWAFPDDGVTFDNQFSGARLNALERIAAHAFHATILPENQPINVSPWYAFRLTATRAAKVTVRLAYPYGNHRYHPKISRDGRGWTPLAETAYRFDRPAKEAVLTLDLQPGALWVAAQEMFGNAELHAWMDTQARQPFVRERVFGRSIEQRPLRLFEFHEGAPPRYVFIVGRQHPPEVTGSLGLVAFVETLTADTAAAREFRREFRTVVMPLLNPDGVEEGHWRSNLGALDLNRDWRKFTQPEIVAVRDTLLAYAAEPGARVFLLLDFHSTQHDIFYTQSEKERTNPPTFTQDWIAGIKRRFPDYELRQEGGHNPGQGTSKGWGFEQFGAPAVTYELGDNTPRPLIRQIVTGAAEEMIRLLLEAR